MKSLYHNISDVFSTQKDVSQESGGYYERVPRRVGTFLLVTNEKGCIAFETTDQAFCKQDIKTVVTISKDGGWSASCAQGGSEWSITPSVDICSERVARRRAMWHAAQYMADRNLSHIERFTLMHQASFDTDPDLYEDDAFFTNGYAVTNDPFGEFLDT